MAGTAGAAPATHRRVGAPSWGFHAVRRLAAWEDKEYLRQVERVLLRKDGSRRAVKVTTTPLTSGAHPVGVVVTIHELQPFRDLKEQVRQRFGFHKLIGKSHRMQAIYRLIEQVADSTASVLIEGESGTGKELVAHAIH